MPTEAAQANRNLAPVEEEVIDPADIIDSSDVPINRDKSYKAQFEHFLRNISQSSSVSIKIFELFSLYPLGTKLKSAQIAQ